MWYIILLIVIGTLFCLFLLSLLGVCLFGLSQKLPLKHCNSTKNLKRRTVLVTGGTAGIGLEIARELARREAKVIIASPFDDEGEKAKNDIIATTDNVNVTFIRLNLASLQSVREFADKILANEYRLDILVNNAGVIFPDKLTDDGMNFVFQVNYFGHFLLTHLLMPLLKKSGTVDDPSRIINISSMIHRFGKIDFKNIDKSGYSGKMTAYCYSKLAVAMFTRELSQRLRREQCNNVTVNSSDPGVSVTQIVPTTSGCMAFMKWMVDVYYPTAKDGAQTTLHIALDEEAGKISGEYFKNCKQIQPANKVFDENISNKLWIESMKKVGIEDTQPKTKDIFIVLE